jgi:hypothetical protein
MASNGGKTYATSAEISAVEAIIADISTAECEYLAGLIGKRSQIQGGDIAIMKTLMTKLCGHPYDKKDILTFVLTEQTGEATIDTEAGTVAIEVAFGTDPSDLTPTITTSTDSTVSPASGVAGDYSSPVVHTVTAEDGTTKEFTVTVTVAAE